MGRPESLVSTDFNSVDVNSSSDSGSVAGCASSPDWDSCLDAAMKLLVEGLIHRVVCMTVLHFGG